jgi:hypothetical protein
MTIVGIVQYFPKCIGEDIDAPQLFLYTTSLDNTLIPLYLIIAAPLIDTSICFVLVSVLTFKHCMLWVWTKSPCPVTSI